MDTEKQKRKKLQMDEALDLQKRAREAGWPAQHWRAWGSWFSWGSPVGLGLFFVLGAIAAAVLIWVIKL